MENKRPLRKILDRLGDFCTIQTILQSLGVWKHLVASTIAILTGVYKVMQSASYIDLFVFGLLAFAATVWVINGCIWAYSRFGVENKRPQTEQTVQTQQEKPDQALLDMLIIIENNHDYILYTG